MKIILKKVFFQRGVIMLNGKDVFKGLLVEVMSVFLFLFVILLFCFLVR